MKVIAKPGTKCPMEGQPKKYITDSRGADVPDTAYYRRLVADGSLKTEGKTAPPDEAKKK